MKKYDVIVSGGVLTMSKSFQSCSRNAKKHIIETGADCCEIYHNGVKISGARRWADGKITNIIL